eukprot:COSAG06_NODE_5231_length_3624_cov_3.016738_3_plen_338_part_00
MVGPWAAASAPLSSFLLLLLLAAARRPPLAAAAASCEFFKDVDFDSNGHGGDLKIVESHSAQECCEQCAAFEGCGKAAWNGEEFHTCYLKTSDAVQKPTAGTTGCQLKKDGAAGGTGLTRGWGGSFVLLGLLGAGIYLIGGVAYGRAQTVGSSHCGDGAGVLNAHPHWAQWRSLAGLVTDGVHSVRGGGPAAPTSQRRQQQSASAAASAAGQHQSYGSGGGTLPAAARQGQGAMVDESGGKRSSSSKRSSGKSSSGSSSSRKRDKERKRSTRTASKGSHSIANQAVAEEEEEAGLLAPAGSRGGESGGHGAAVREVLRVEGGQHSSQAKVQVEAITL